MRLYELQGPSKRDENLNILHARENEDYSQKSNVRLT